MDKILNVLYQTDDNYAPQTGISMVSLFENNKDLPEINVFVLDDKIGDNNKAKMREAAEMYGRSIEFVDTTAILNRLIELDVEPFRNTYTTYFKLLAIGNIQTKNDLLLQIDGDTIINESLAGLFDIDLDDKVCAATYECVQNSYKPMVGIDEDDKYYNCGVLWINQKMWRDYDCENKIIEHLGQSRNRYFTVDQDIINVLFRDKIAYLDIAYNLNSGFYLYGIDDSFFIYDLDESFFSKKKQVKHALERPIINHCMGPMTGRPWEQDNIHPQNNLYDEYLAISPWKDVPKITVNRTGMFKLQRNMYQMLPRAIYKRIHKSMLKSYLRKKNQESVESGI